MIVAAKQLKGKNASVMKNIVEQFDNKVNLVESLKNIQGGGRV
jgi:phosphopantothenate synthetase